MRDHHRGSGDGRDRAAADPAGLGADRHFTTIVLGADANLWFIESATTANKIARITPAGAITEFPIPTANAFAVWSTAGPDGNIWFTESNTGKVAHIKP